MPQPTAHSPQPTAHSPQPTAGIFGSSVVLGPFWPDGVRRACAAILAIVFGTAALSKGSNPQEAIVAVSAAFDVALAPAWLLMFPVIWVEWALAVALILLRRNGAAFVMSLVLLVIMTVFLLRLTTLESVPACGCGRVSDLLAKATGSDSVRWALGRNALLMGCCVVGLVAEQRRWRREIGT